MPDLVGKRLGDFELLRPIGRGGMGMVYEARQLSLNRRVALKVLSAGLLASESTIIRFQREAQAAAKLKHDHIVPIYAQDECEGLYYYAMELIEGRPLSQVISALRHADSRISPAISPTQTLPRSEPLAETVALPRAPVVRPSTIAKPAAAEVTVPLSPANDHYRQITRRIAEVAEALHYAHQQGVIHRDIKPHNLLQDQSGRLRITDFGLSRMISEPGVTMTGEFIGSPSYMSPEQIRGPRQSTDPRSDVYSLGATLYEWLTLRVPHPGESPEEIIAHIATQEVLPPRALNRTIPHDLETICLKALAREREQRYLSAGELAADLRRYLEGYPILARRAGTMERLGKLLMRHRLAVTAAAVVVTLCVVLAALLKQSLRTQQMASQSGTALVSVTAERDTLKKETEQLREQLDLLKMIAMSPEQIGAPLLESAPKVLQQLDQLSRSGNRANATQPIPAMEQGVTGLSRVAESATAMFNQLLMLPEAPRREVVQGALAFDTTRRWIRMLPTTLQNQTPTNQQVAEDYWLAISVRDPVQKLKYLDQALQKDPRFTPALYMRCLLCCAERNYKDMLADAELLVRLDAPSIDALGLCASARLLNDQPREALRLLENRRVEVGQDHWLQALRGLSLLLLGDPSAARTSLEEVRREHPELVLAAIGLAQACIEQGLAQQALTHANAAVESDAINGYAYLMRGLTRDQLLDYSGANEDYSKSIELGITSRFVLGRKYQALENLRTLQPATESTDSLDQLLPDNPLQKPNDAS
ncbi:MAG: Serine/threonine-protein kinase PknD [Phycisphaerae bacterium]|nr:Serine/threonine-protein kinase PknD [Phycisphaerae bacterium]